MTEQLATLQQELLTLKEQTADRHNPVKFRYIESMAQRAGAQSEAVAIILAEKARSALDEYQQTYDLSHPHIHTVSSKSHATPVADSAANDLVALTKLLNEQATSQGDDPDSTPLDELMRIQEADVVNALGPQTLPESQRAVARAQELKSARRFRNARVKVNADKLVTQAVEEIPEESGPLNSQRLAARSLAAMRDLSPYYLSRFVTYMDTLFWLEQTEKEKWRQ